MTTYKSIDISGQWQKFIDIEPCLFMHPSRPSLPLLMQIHLFICSSLFEYTQKYSFILSPMASYAFALVIVLLYAVTIDSRRHSHHHQQNRRFWQNLQDYASNKFHIDFRHFDDENMVLFPEVGFQTAKQDGSWKLVLHGWRYENSKGRNWFGITASDWVKRIAKQMLSPEAILYLNGSLNRDRLKPFFYDDESNEWIRIKLGDSERYVQTDHTGEFSEEIEVPNEVIDKLRLPQAPDVITYTAIGDQKDTAQGVIRLIEPRHGISVISDVDDTIKVSEVLDKVRLLANTFIHSFIPVTGKCDRENESNLLLLLISLGMAELYQNWRSKNGNMTFHYLSGMPDQLYTLTQEFIYTNNFPDGSFHMRHFGWALGSLFTFLHSESTFTHKMNYLRFFFANTVRDFVLVGDSGEKDPEIYGTIAREYPDRVRAIFIRAIKSESFDDERFLTAFQDVAPEKWQVFNDPKQVPLDLSRSPRATAG